MGQKLEDVILPQVAHIPPTSHHSKAQKKPPMFCCRRRHCTGENAARQEVFFGGNCNASWGRERTIVKPSKSCGIRIS